MRSAEDWAPSKYVLQDGVLRGSRDRDEVSTGSRLITDRVARAYQQMINEHATGRLLDFGCGAAPLYGVYRDVTSEAVCVDWSNSGHTNRHVDRPMDLTHGAPDLATEGFDTILATDVLEHLPYPELVWRDFARLLRPGGKVLVGVPFAYWLHEEPHDYHRYTHYALERHAADAGLRAVHLRPYGGPLEILVDILAKLTAPVPPVSAAISALGLWFTGLAPIRRLTARARDKMPLGYVGVFVKDA